MLNPRFSHFKRQSWFGWYLAVNLLLIQLSNGQSSDLAHSDHTRSSIRSLQKGNGAITKGSPRPRGSLNDVANSDMRKYPEDISGVWENTTNVPAYDFNGHVRRESTFKLTLMQEENNVKGTFLMRVYMSGGVVQKYTRVSGTYKEGYLKLKTIGIIKEGCYAPENVSGLYDLIFEGKITNENGVLILDGHYDFATQKSFQTKNGTLIFSNAVLGLKGPVKIFAQRTVALKPEVEEPTAEEQPELPPPMDSVQVFTTSDTIFNHILFKQSETDFLSPKDSLEMVRLGNLLQNYPHLKVALNGYTENRGTLRENIDLSRKRSEFLKKYLMDKKNINSERIITTGFGPYNPVGDNRNESTRQLNRRVEIKVFTN